MHRLDDLLPIGEAAKLKGVSVDTWRRWEKGEKIKAYRTEGRHRRYKVSELLKIEDPRVSTRDKKDDLQRQISVLEKYCQSRGWVDIYTLCDIGSGMNYKKRGLLKLVDLLFEMKSND